MRSARGRPRAWAAYGAACVLGMLFVGASRAATLTVVAGGANLAAAIAAAAPGDVLTLAAGVHNGPVRIEKPLTLAGLPGAVLDGRGVGRTIEVTAADVTVRNLSIRGSGMSLETMDAAVFLGQSASHAQVLDNDIEGNLVGVYIHGAPGAIVRTNKIVGRVLTHLNDSGNGVYVWNAPGAQVLDNDISGGRDGIFTNTSRNDRFVGNRIHGVRFAVHYMYTNDSEVSGNTSIGNHAGFVIMYSSNLTIRGNVSDADRDHGLLFNYANASEIDNNAVRHSDQCVFIYNANHNRFRDNLFEGCRVGVHFTAGSEGNDITDNAFIANQTQVMYVGTRFLDWSANGRGNYWSDNPAFDLNGDGIADTAYRPNNIMDEVIWRAPAAKLLLNSPAARVVRWAQAQFPAIHPGGVIDSAPLMSPPRIAAASRLGSAQR
jgi:nitrous oxidase accessory protein